MTLPRWLDSIKTRVTLSVLVVFLVSLWVLALLITRMLERDITKLVTNGQTSVTVQLASQLDRALTDRIQALEKTAALITPEMMQDTQSLQSFLEDRVLLQEMFNVSVLALDAYGVSIADAPYDPARIGFNYRTFIEVFARTLEENRSFIGDPLFGRLLDEPLIPFSVPIRDDNGQLIGALGGAINLREPNLLEEMTREGYGERGFFSIVSKDSRVVVTSSDPELLMYQLPPTGVDETIDRAMAGEEGSFRYTTVYGIDSLGTVTGLDSVNWFVTTISPLEEAFAPIGSMKRQLLFSTLLITMLVGLAMWWLLRSQLKPIFSTIQSLGDASGALDLAREVPLTGKQEIDALISSFNQLLNEWYERGEENQRFKTIADNAVYGMAIADMQGRLTYINPFFAQRHGYRVDELIGKNISIFHTAEQLTEVEVSLKEMSQDGAFSPRELWHVDREGKPFPMLMSGVLLTNAEGRSAYMATSAIDITERKQAEHEIHQLAYYDLLTSLPNRRLLQDQLKHAMAVSRRSGRHGALIFLDIDNFKTLNDTRGHDTGDQLLLETARRIRANARDTDTVARLGGDEFVVILEGLSDDREQAALDARKIGDSIRVSLAKPFQFKDAMHHASASLGITLFSGTQQSVETLLKQADLAMYRAKEMGKNTVRFFDPDMQIALDERAALEADLRAALDLDQLHLCFQPQVDQHGKICGAEALLRWDHPEHGSVPPDRFIPIAEATGQILRIGRWVLDSACQQLERWSEQFPEMDLTLAVNVSPEEFRQADFVDQVRALLQHRKIDLSRLRLELTETMMVEEVEVTIKQMEALKNLGIGFSLDDFGTGYSSLSYLTRLPLDTLKIDKTFVLNLPDNHNDAVIAQTVISMAQSLELDVIAEGVETVEQRDFLVNHGCVSFQGYLFSPPVPQADFEKLLEEGTALLANKPPL